MVRQLIAISPLINDPYLIFLLLCYFKRSYDHYFKHNCKTNWYAVYSSEIQNVIVWKYHPSSVYSFLKKPIKISQTKYLKSFFGSHILYFGTLTSGYMENKLINLSTSPRKLLLYILKDSPGANSVVFSQCKHQSCFTPWALLTSSVQLTPSSLIMQHTYFDLQVGQGLCNNCNSQGIMITVLIMVIFLNVKTFPNPSVTPMVRKRIQEAWSYIFWGAFKLIICLINYKKKQKHIYRKCHSSRC